MKEILYYSFLSIALLLCLWVLWRSKKQKIETIQTFKDKAFEEVKKQYERRDL